MTVTLPYLTLRAFLLVSLSLSFFGCDTGRVKESASPASKEGIVQAKVGDDGIPRIAIAVGAKKPGGKAPDLSGLRGVDLINLGPASGASESGIRSKRVFHFPLGGLHMGTQPRWLETMYTGGYSPDEEIGIGVPHYSLYPTPEDIVCYASSRYVVYDQWVDFAVTPKQTVSYSHGPYKATAEIFMDNGIVYASINGGPAQFAWNSGGQVPRIAYLSMYLPLNSGLTPLEAQPESPLTTKLVLLAVRCSDSKHVIPGRISKEKRCA